jgi:hypothetical protein
MDGDDQHMGIASAFNLGFRSEAMRTRHKYWDFDVIQSQLEWLAGELKPNTFPVVAAILADLKGQGSSLSRSKKALDLLEEYSNTWSFNRLPTEPELHALATRLLEWKRRAWEFADHLRRAVRDDSPFRIWFDCGRRLGECAATANSAHPSKYKSLQVFAQRSLQGLPPNCICAIDWLRTYVDFHFDGPVDWESLGPPYDSMKMFAVGPRGLRERPKGQVRHEVRNLADLVDYVRARFVTSIPKIVDTLADAETSRRPKNRGGGRRANPAPEAVPETKSRKGRGKWPEARTQPAVAQYLSEHAGLYNELVPLVLQGDAEGFKKFKANFGATAIARAITNKSGGGTEDSCGKSQVQVAAAYRAAVSPLLKRPPQRPPGWESREVRNALNDYLQYMSPE